VSRTDTRTDDQRATYDLASVLSSVIISSVMARPVISRSTITPGNKMSTSHAVGRAYYRRAGGKEATEDRQTAYRGSRPWENVERMVDHRDAWSTTDNICSQCSAARDDTTRTDEQRELSAAKLSSCTNDNVNITTSLLCH